VKETESPMGMAQSYLSGQQGSLVVVIPIDVKEKLKLKKGSKFLVKIDSQGRIIYEPLASPLTLEVKTP
jgi:antitoxin component of MazEF toxin-antitoxin module